MALTQEDDYIQDNIIYYPSKGLIGLELRYSHVEILALAAIHVVQIL